MKKLGGEPLVDRVDSVKRFKQIVQPILEKAGFTQIKKNGHTMINDSDKTIMICKSCPSDIKHIKEMKQIVRELKKKYEGYTPYTLFHRNKEEWINKPVYVSVLQSIMKNKQLKGVIVGLDALASSLEDVSNCKLIYKI